MAQNSIFSKFWKWLTVSWLDLLSIGLICIFSFFIWSPTRFFPFHWDSAGFVMNAVENLVNTGFKPFAVIGSDFAHPPLLIALLAVIWQFSQRSIMAMHIVMLPFLPVLMISTYFIGKKLHSITLGILAAFTTGFIPVVIAEYGIIYLDLPAGTLATLAAALYLYHHKTLSLIILSSAVLIKANVLLVLPMLIFWEYYLLNSRRRLKSYFIFLLPVFILSLWFIYHRFNVGWFFVDPQAQISHRLTSSLGDLVQSVGFILRLFFVDQARWLLLIGLGSTIYLWFNRHRPNLIPRLYECLGFTVTITVSLVFFVVFSEFTGRYAIFLYPYLILLSLYLLAAVLDRISPRLSNWWLILFTLIVSVSFTYNWYPQPSKIIHYEFQPPSDLGYTDMINVFRQLGAYLQIYAPQDTLYGAFPENLYLTQSFQGYVQLPLHFSECKNYRPNLSVRQLIILHAYSPGQITCRQLMDTYNITPVQKFERNGKWVELYEISATTSAELSQPAPKSL
jgi:4-amino-4-deoxy-L-arabinose transferase-like glycosyltransferase